MDKQQNYSSLEDSEVLIHATHGCAFKTLSENIILSQSQKATYDSISRKCPE